MDKSYYKNNYDLNRCSVSGLIMITVLYRLLGLFSRRYAGKTPGIADVVTAYVMHRFFYFFHYLYMLRDALRKIGKRLRIFYVFRVRR
ncbi:MAG: hypothetical protein SFH39_06955 [Candidatus Magnetobacterium sp. LHC-1]|uniref:Transposase n=1 Tax=Candidatus Magnetobacterium casense TaxID=1455061 RepID=A0ABS6S2W1_9BACT|nr:hypothetical protein [Candidatus Magnetobacterium casensis]MBF0607135.1 hypothetical protein [Nitrospirota bacterium]MBV6343183.1 hypothetical protein [Candidatus Magnetobacterium casensis]